MNLRDLRYLIAVAENRHFGKAAEACFVSQPTLSAQLKKLEEHLGVTLFERTNRSVRITPIGTQVLEHARKALAQVKLMEEVARAHQDPLSGPLRLGVIPTLAPYLMPLVLMPLLEAYPQMRLVLNEDLTAHLLDQLNRYEVDAALIATPVNDPSLEQWPLFDEPFWLAHPREHRLYDRDEIHAEDLPVEELLLLGEGHCLTDQVLDICGTQDKIGRGNELRAASLETLMQLVGAGLGCTLVPALALRGSWSTDTGVIMRPLEMVGAKRQISLVFRSSFPRRMAIEAFANVVWSKLPNTVRSLKSESAESLTQTQEKH